MFACSTYSHLFCLFSLSDCSTGLSCRLELLSTQEVWKGPLWQASKSIWGDKWEAPRYHTVALMPLLCLKGRESAWSSLGSLHWLRNCRFKSIQLKSDKIPFIATLDLSSEGHYRLRYVLSCLESLSMKCPGIVKPELSFTVDNSLTSYT